MLGVSLLRWVQARDWCPLHWLWAPALPRPGHVTPALRRGAQLRPAAASPTHHQKLRLNERKMMWSRSFRHNICYTQWSFFWNLNGWHKSILFGLQPPLLVMISSQQQPQLASCLIPAPFRAAASNDDGHCIIVRHLLTHEYCNCQ